MSWFYSQHVLLQAFFASAFMYLLTALGASFVLFSKRINKTVLTLLTGSAAGIMIAASFFSLLLPALSYEGALPAVLTVTLGFCSGGAFIILSDLFFSRRLAYRAGNGRRNTALLYLAVTLHNIPEGMAVGVALAQASGLPSAVLSALFLALGIGIQNFPEGLCVAFPLRQSGMGRGKSFLLAQGSGAVEMPACILGALAASVILSLMPWALSFSAGAMMAVVCSELIPECFEGNKTLASAGIILGFCCMMALDVALG